MNWESLIHYIYKITLIFNNCKKIKVKMQKNPRRENYK